jgi:hypothetical protein
MKTKIKNFSLHPIRLNKELEKQYEIIEPRIDKRKLIIETEKILGGKCTMINEQYRIIGVINDCIESGDVIYVAGHPALVVSICIIAQIKGAMVVTGMIDLKTKEVVKIEELITNSQQLDRKHRLEIEYKY